MTTKIERFEDLIAWQKARKLTKESYAFTNRALRNGLRTEGSNSMGCCFKYVKHGRRI